MNSNKQPIIFNKKISVSDPQLDINKIYRNYKSLIKTLQLYFSKNESIRLVNKLIALKILELKSGISIKYHILDNIPFLSIIGKFLNKIDYLYLNEYFQELVIIPYSTLIKLLKQIDKMNLVYFIDNNRSLNDIIGAIFEKHINKKEVGAYYTSNETTNYIVEKTIISYLVNDNNSFKEIIKSKSIFDYIKKQSKEKTLNKLRSIKILDPTCGSGSFLFSAYFILRKIYNLLFDNLNNKELFHFIFKNNLFGIDIDEESIKLLRFRIIIESIQHKDNNFTELFDNFIVGNTLVGSIETKKKTDINVEDEKTFNLQNNREIFPAINKEVWPSKTEPLHLGIIYKDILNNGGFDCIIGNPPYVEKNKVSYNLSNYFNYKTGNLYAPVLERSINLLKEKGTLGMVVPISFISTPRMKPIREFLNKKLDYQFISSFADRPSSLFHGVHQKLNIIIGRKNSNKTDNYIYTSSYIHCNKSNKHLLFDNIRYIENDINTNNQFYYKVGNKIEKNILLKVLKKTEFSIIDNIDKNGRHNVWLNMRLLFWNKSFLEEQISKEYKKFSFNQEFFATIFYSLTNSNLFFFFWELVSDGWHITNKDLSSFKINFNDFSDEMINKLETINKELMYRLEQTKKEINSKQTNFEYQHKKAKDIIDKYDNIFGKYYLLTKQEINYLKFYNIEYRMNSELNNYLKNKKYEYI